MSSDFLPSLILWACSLLSPFAVEILIRSSAYSSMAWTSTIGVQKEITHFCKPHNEKSTKNFDSSTCYFINQTSTLWWILTHLLAAFILAVEQNYTGNMYPFITALLKDMSDSIPAYLSACYSSTNMGPLREVFEAAKRQMAGPISERRALLPLPSIQYSKSVELSQWLLNPANEGWHTTYRFSAHPTGRSLYNSGWS